LATDQQMKDATPISLSAFKPITVVHDSYTGNGPAIGWTPDPPTQFISPKAGYALSAIICTFMVNTDGDPFNPVIIAVNSIELEWRQPYGGDQMGEPMLSTSHRTSNKDPRQVGQGIAIQQCRCANERSFLTSSTWKTVQVQYQQQWSLFGPSDAQFRIVPGHLKPLPTSRVEGNIEHHPPPNHPGRGSQHGKGRKGEKGHEEREGHLSGHQTGSVQQVRHHSCDKR
jgi:hypothetical protein